MEDKNLVNKPVKVEQIIEALRCTSAPGGPIGDCKKCPFWKKENLTPEQAKQLGADEWASCDIDRVGMAAADRLANDQTHIAALQKEIKKLRSDRRWIPVTEKLPEVWCNDETAELVNYMIYSPDFGVDIGNYHAQAKKWLCMALPCTVTHWMPLLEPPEVE